MLNTLHPLTLSVHVVSVHVEQGKRTDERAAAAAVSVLARSRGRPDGPCIVLMENPPCHVMGKEDFHMILLFNSLALHSHSA